MSTCLCCSVIVQSSSTLWRSYIPKLGWFSAGQGCAPLRWEDEKCAWGGVMLLPPIQARSQHCFRLLGYYGVFFLRSAEIRSHHHGCGVL